MYLQNIAMTDDNSGGLCCICLRDACPFPVLFAANHAIRFPCVVDLLLKDMEVEYCVQTVIQIRKVTLKEMQSWANQRRNEKVTSLLTSLISSDSGFHQ